MNVPEIEEATRQSILDHNMEVLYYLTMQPGNMIELGLALFIGIMVLTFTISKIHILGKTGAASLLLTLFAVITCLFFVIQVTSFTKVWFIPMIEQEARTDVIIVCLLVTAFLFMIIPFTRFLLKSGYFLCLSAWLSGLVIAFIALSVFSQTYEQPRSDSTPAEAMENIRDSIQKRSEAIKSP